MENVRVLLTLDEYKPSRLAFHTAIDGIRRLVDVVDTTRVDVTIISIIDPSSIAAFYDGSNMDSAASRTQRLHVATEQLNKLHRETQERVNTHVVLMRAALDAAYATVSGETKEGNPGDILAEMASEYDIVYMGTHGRRGFSRFLLGSVAENVIRNAVGTPVIAVRCDEAREADETAAPTRTLVLCDDGSEAGSILYERAVLLLPLLGASSVTILRVVSEKTGANAGEVEPIEKKLMERGEQLKATALGPVEVTVRVVGSKEATHDAIVDMASAANSAILMGTHGRSGLSRVFLGSVAEKTLRAAPSHIPIAVVRYK